MFNAHAETPAARLDQLLQSIHTLRADFTQTVMDNRGRSISKSHGVFSLQRPGKLRWEITHPDAELIIANQDKIFIYEPDLQQLTIKKLNLNIGEAPALLFTRADITSSKNFDVQFDQHKIPGQEWFLLIPKDHSGFFSSIHLGFVKNTLLAMQLRDSLDQVTTVEFSHVKTNPALSLSIFNIKVPPKTDVIHETEK
ncbi:MAG: outer membrane lipoprotein chaperone LolA [Gammaproteobacteria bacterium]|nr:outer membrane lipoprotein chaperone LolA [Gammaproteobacteria bacterium]